MSDENKGRIFNIQRYSIHDGAGIRTLVFFKGCPLKCLWCSNPESQKHGPELGFIEARCDGNNTCDASCVSACPEGAISLNGTGKPDLDRHKCNACGKCAEACVHDALKLVGHEMSVAEVLAEIEKDRPFYRRSGGGMTVGGGEPLAQYGFAAALLEAAGEEYIHTAIETTGHAKWEHFEAVIQHVDLLQMDLKHMDPETHKKLTGVSNELILDNLKKVLSIKESQDVIIRIPVIPQCNDSAENIDKTARYISELGFTKIELMPYHRLGVSKYKQYGMDYLLDGTETLTTDNLKDLKKIVEGYGLQKMTGRI